MPKRICREETPPEIDDITISNKPSLEIEQAEDAFRRVQAQRTKSRNPIRSGDLWGLPKATGDQLEETRERVAEPAASRQS